MEKAAPLWHPLFVVDLYADLSGTRYGAAAIAERQSASGICIGGGGASAGSLSQWTAPDTDGLGASGTTMAEKLLLIFR